MTTLLLTTDSGCGTMDAEAIYNSVPPWCQTALMNLHAVRIELHRYGQRFARAVDNLRSSERWDRDRLERFQGDRLRRIVRHAYRHSPFYRRSFDRAGLTPDDIRGTSDLGRIPLLTKEDLRLQGDGLRTRRRPARNWRHGHTSGTTGSPVSLWYDRNTCVMTNAVDWRQKEWAGMRPGDWLGVLLGRAVVPPESPGVGAWRTNWIQRQVWFSSHHLTDSAIDSYVREMRRRGLRYLEGYPSTLYIVASHLLRRGERLPLGAAFTSSETLHDIQRETIEAAFECPVFDFYGLAERVAFAVECEIHDGKHLCEEYGITEVVDANGEAVAPGQHGFLVGTSLHNTATPLLRYRTGDTTAILEEPCRCGRPARRIANVTTKAEDILVTPAGRLISPSTLTHPFKPYEEIRMSKIVQEAPDHVRILVVDGGELTADREASLLAEFRRRVGVDVEVHVERVDAIPRDPSGKFRWVVSRVPHDGALSWTDE